MSAARGLLLLGLAACASHAEVPSAEGGPLEALGDQWIGGDESTPYLQLDFASDVARTSADEQRAPLGIIHPRLLRDPGGHEEARFTLDGAVVDQKGASFALHLVRVATLAPEAVDAALGGGTYAIAGEPRHLLFVNDGRVFDTRDGSDRRLHLLDRGRALVGSGVDMAAPSFGIATRDHEGALRIERPGGALLAPRAEPAREVKRVPGSLSADASGRARGSESSSAATCAMWHTRDRTIAPRGGSRGGEPLVLPERWPLDRRLRRGGHALSSSPRSLARSRRRSPLDRLFQ